MHFMVLNQHLKTFIIILLALFFIIVNLLYMHLSFPTGDPGFLFMVAP